MAPNLISTFIFEQSTGCLHLQVYWLVCILWGIISQRHSVSFRHMSSAFLSLAHSLLPYSLSFLLRILFVRLKQLMLWWVLMVQLYWHKIQRVSHKTDQSFQSVKYYLVIFILLFVFYRFSFLFFIFYFFYIYVCFLPSVFGRYA